MFPTELDRELRRWYADGGDQALRYSYDLDCNSLVIDLGGYKGQWASDIYGRYNSQILIFEPVKRYADDIIRRFEKNQKMRVFSIALGASNRQEFISLNNDGSSLFRQSGIKEAIQIVDVAAFFSEHSIAEVDLMKINVEGGEYELLKRLIETNLINRVKSIQIQFHNISSDSERQMESLKARLASTHQPSYQYKFVWENWIRHV